MITSQNKKDNFWKTVFWSCFFLTSLYKLYISTKLNICFDEGYYYFWSSFPQLSYLDHPPLTAWAIWLSKQIFGHSIWAIRFWPIVCGIAFAFVGRRLACDMFDREVGNLAGTVLLLGPVFFSNGFIMTPDCLFVVLWATAIMFTWYAIQDHRPSSPWWVAVGICSGLGALAKYNMVIFFIGLGLLMLTNKQWRQKIFLGGLVAGIISLIIFMPVILWNYQHDWVSFFFQIKRGSTSKYSSLTNLGFYATGILLIVTPLLSLATFKTCFTETFRSDPRYRFLAAFFWSVVIFFGYFAFKARIQANWPMVAFFTGLIALAANWNIYPSLFRRLTIGLLFIVDAYMLIYLALPPQFPFQIFNWTLDPRRMREFYQADVVADTVRQKFRETEAIFIFCQSHQMLGTLAYYTPELNEVLWSTEADNKRYPWVNYRKWDGHNALMVGYKEFDLKELLQFNHVTFLGKVEIPVKQNLSRAIYLYLGKGYKADFTPDDLLLE